ncbi:MAG TPA: TIGR04282 family arsenosugar biosynthesis glycosyltransferase [Thermoanaerobaculia bacterium]
MFPTTPPPTQRLLVFARLPELGKVKTRLASSIGAEKALAVYEAMLRDLLASIGPSTADTDVEIVWAPSESANGNALQRAFPGYSLAMQTGTTLGDRLTMAFSERFFFQRTEKIIAIGVDDPRLTRGSIDHAFGLLDSCEWVIGPASDGGYYLIGCRAASFDSSIFAGIDWGTDSVLQTTINKIEESDRTLAVLPTHSDIDVVDDLRRFAGDGGDGELPRLLRGWDLGVRRLAAAL